MKKIIQRLQQDSYTDFIGLIIGIIVGFFISIKFNIIIGIIAAIILSLLLAQIIHQLCIYYIAKVNAKLMTKNMKANPEEVKLINERLKNIIELENELTKFLDDFSSGKSSDFSEKELNKKWEEKQSYFIESADNIFKGMNNIELMLTIASTDNITQIVDIFEYFKPFTPDFEYMASHPDNLIEYYCQILWNSNVIYDLNINEYYYTLIKEKVDLERLESFVLSKMSNKELMKLASMSDDWQKKLYYYGYMDKEK